MQLTSVLRSLGLAAAFAVALALAGCTEPPAPNANPASTNAPQAPTTNAAAPAQTPPKPAGDAKAPLGMEDTIEGRVIGLRCYKDNRNASLEAAKACAEANLAKGGSLGILGSDGTVYVNATSEASVTNAQLQYFIGQEVTIQGQMIGDMPDLSWDDVKVKKFKFGLVRRKGAPPPGTPRQTAPATKP